MNPLGHELQEVKVEEQVVHGREQGRQVTIKVEVVVPVDREADLVAK